jgi:hypothetical protein
MAGDPSGGGGSNAPSPGTQGLGGIRNYGLCAVRRKGGSDPYVIGLTDTTLFTAPEDGFLVIFAISSIVLSSGDNFSTFPTIANAEAVSRGVAKVGLGQSGDTRLNNSRHGVFVVVSGATVSLPNSNALFIPSRFVKSTSPSQDTTIDGLRGGDVVLSVGTATQINRTDSNTIKIDASNTSIIQQPTLTAANAAWSSRIARNAPLCWFMGTLNSGATSTNVAVVKIGTEVSLTEMYTLVLDGRLVASSNYAGKTVAINGGTLYNAGPTATVTATATARGTSRSIANSTDQIGYHTSSSLVVAQNNTETSSGNSAGLLLKAITGPSPIVYNYNSGWTAGSSKSTSFNNTSDSVQRVYFRVDWSGWGYDGGSYTVNFTSSQGSVVYTGGSRTSSGHNTQAAQVTGIGYVDIPAGATVTFSQTVSGDLGTTGNGQLQCRNSGSF